LLFSGAVRTEPPRLVRPPALVVAELAGLLAGPPDPRGPRPVPPDVLLLPGRLLQVLLGGPAVLQGGGAAQVLPRREDVPPHHAERPPLLHVRGAALPDRAG